MKRRQLKQKQEMKRNHRPAQSVKSQGTISESVLTTSKYKTKEKALTHFYCNKIDTQYAI
jgi:hypothetical protein